MPKGSGHEFFIVPQLFVATMYFTIRAKIRGECCKNQYLCVTLRHEKVATDRWFHRWRSFGRDIGYTWFSPNQSLF